MIQTYNLIGEEGYIALALKVREHVESAAVRELKYVKVKGKDLMYHVYVVDKFPSPTLDGLTTFTGVGRTDELSDLLQIAFTDRGNLPHEVRVIRPDRQRDQWGVFVRR